MRKRAWWKGERALWGTVLFPFMVLGLGYVSIKESSYVIDFG